MQTASSVRTTKKIDDHKRYTMTAQELNKYRKKRHYILKKSWQKSIRTTKTGSRCRHAKSLVRSGRRYKGGR